MKYISPVEGKPVKELLMQARHLFELRFPGIPVEYSDIFGDYHAENDDTLFIMFTASVETRNGEYNWVYGETTSFRWCFDFFRDYAGYDYHGIDEPTPEFLYECTLKLHCQ